MRAAVHTDFSDSVAMLKKTPLHDTHVALGAKMVNFAGFTMPIQYAGIRAEHMAVRQAAGLFDVSHMGEIFVMGPQASTFVQHLVTNDVTRLSNFQAMYTVMCNEEGGVVDDLLVYRFREDAYMLVVNAANIAEDLAWMESQNTVGAALHNTSDYIALFALQGPRSLEIMAKVTDIAVSDLPFYHFVRPAPGTFFGCEKSVISRTGYTGEVGLEIYMEREAAEQVWDAIMDAGAPLGLVPCGLGARDTLRLEAGYCLYGHELDISTNPFEAKLGWVTKLNKGPFVGHEALRSIKNNKPSRTLIGLILDQRGIPRQDYPVTDLQGRSIGSVTSGTMSPVLSQGIAMAYVPNRTEYTSLGTTLGITIRGKMQTATVVKPPFFKLGPSGN